MPLSFNTLPPIAAGGSSGRSSLAGNYANTGRLASGLSRHNENVAKGIQERRKELKEEEKELNLLRSQARSYLQLGEKYIDREFSEDDKETNPEYQKANAFWEALRDSMNRRSLPEMRDAVGRMVSLFNTHNWLREQKALDRQATEERLQNKQLQQKLDQANQAAQLSAQQLSHATLNDAYLRGLRDEDFQNFTREAYGDAYPLEGTLDERKNFWTSQSMGPVTNALIPTLPSRYHPEAADAAMAAVKDFQARRQLFIDSQKAAVDKKEEARLDRRNRTVMGVRNAQGNPLPPLATVEHRDHAAELIKDTATMLDAIATLMAVERWYYERSRTLGGKNITKEDARAPLGIVNQARKELVTPVRTMLEDKGNLGQQERPVFEQITEGGALVDDLDVFFKKVATRSALLNAWINTEKRLTRAMAALNFENEEDRPFDVNAYVPKVSKRGIKKSMPDGSRRLMRLEDGPWREEPLEEILTPEDQRWREDNRKIWQSRVDESVSSWLKANEVQSFDELNQIGNAGLRDQFLKFLKGNFGGGYAGEYVRARYLPALNPTAPDDYPALPEEQLPAQTPTETGSVPMETEEPAEEPPDARSLIVAPPAVPPTQPQPPAVEEEVPVDAPIEERIARLQQRIAAGEFNLPGMDGLNPVQEFYVRKAQKLLEGGDLGGALQQLQHVKHEQFFKGEANPPLNINPDIEAPTEPQPQASAGGAGIPNLADAISRIPRTGNHAPLNLLAPLPPLARNVPLMPRSLVNRSPIPMLPISGAGEAVTRGQPQPGPLLPDWDSEAFDRQMGLSIAPLPAGPAAASEEANLYARGPDWLDWFTTWRDPERAQIAARIVPRWLGGPGRSTPPNDKFKPSFEEYKMILGPNRKWAHNTRLVEHVEKLRSEGRNKAADRFEEGMLRGEYKRWVDNPAPLTKSEKEEWRVLTRKGEQRTEEEEARWKVLNWGRQGYQNDALTPMEWLKGIGSWSEVIPLVGTSLGTAGRAVTGAAGTLGKGAGALGKGLGGAGNRLGLHSGGQKLQDASEKMMHAFRSPVPEPPLHARARQVAADNPGLIPTMWLNKPAPTPGYGLGRTPGGRTLGLPDVDLRAWNLFKNRQARMALAQAGKDPLPAPTPVGRFVEEQIGDRARKMSKAFTGGQTKFDYLNHVSNKIAANNKEILRLDGGIDKTRPKIDGAWQRVPSTIKLNQKGADEAMDDLIDMMDGMAVPGKFSKSPRFTFDKNDPTSLANLKENIKHWANAENPITHPIDGPNAPHLREYPALHEFLNKYPNIRSKVFEYRKYQMDANDGLKELVRLETQNRAFATELAKEASRQGWKQVAKWGWLIPTLGGLSWWGLNNLFDKNK